MVEGGDEGRGEGEQGGVAWAVRHREAKPWNPSRT